MVHEDEAWSLGEQGGGASGTFAIGHFGDT